MQHLLFRASGKVFKNINMARRKEKKLSCDCSIFIVCVFFKDKWKDVKVTKYFFSVYFMV